MRPFAAMTLEQWQTVIAINLTGQFLCAREAVRRFTRQQQQRPVEGLRQDHLHEFGAPADSVGRSCQLRGVQRRHDAVDEERRAGGCGAAHPRQQHRAGRDQDPINEDAWSTPQAEQSLLELIPYGRIGEVEDIAQAAVWLASDESDYVTGTTLFVDGGMSLYPGFRDNG